MSLIEVLINEEKGKVYLILEYCSGVLKDIIENSATKKLPHWHAHYFFTQLIDGLDYLHSRNVVHKDIKPGNLLINNCGILKIADFGVAEQLDKEIQSWIIRQFGISYHHD